MAPGRFLPDDGWVRSRALALVFGLLVVFPARWATAQTVSEALASTPSVDDAAASPDRPRARRFEITPMGGYRIEGDLTTKSGTPYSHTSFDDAPTFGIAVDYALSDRCLGGGSVQLRGPDRNGVRCEPRDSESRRRDEDQRCPVLAAVQLSNFQRASPSLSGGRRRVHGPRSGPEPLALRPGGPRVSRAASERT